MLKLVNYPEIHCALRDAFLATFDDTDYGYEQYGVLLIDLEEREQIKSEMVKPKLDDYKRFLVAIEEDDDDAIEEFEAFAESIMRNLERQFIEWMKQQLR